MADKYALPKGIFINGVRYPINITPERLEAIKNNFKFRDADIVLGTFPRSGTTWIQFILEIMRTKQKIDGEKGLFHLQPFLAFIREDNDPDKESMFAKFNLTMSQVDALPDPRIIKTHLLYDLVPKNPKTKYIYVYRNPKDCLVSCYYHVLGKRVIFDYSGKMEDYSELFLNGQADFGSWWDHVAGWWEHRNDPNVLILSYEDIYLNFKENVGKIAKFTGFEMDEDLFQLIAAECGLEAMKANKLFNTFKVPPLPEELKDIVDPQNLHHIRKGGIGGWKNEISESVSKRIDEVTNEKFKNISIKDFIKYD